MKASEAKVGGKIMVPAIPNGEHYEVIVQKIEGEWLCYGGSFRAKASVCRLPKEEDDIAYKFDKSKNYQASKNLPKRTSKWEKLSKALRRITNK